jgi:hypothetical protein
LFHTDQDAEIIAKNLTTSIVSLRKWWLSAFGKEAVQQRGKARTLHANLEKGLPEGQVRLCKCGAVCRLGYYDCNACNNATSKAYHTNNLERLLVRDAKVRAKEYDVPFNITTEYIKSCIPVDGCCPITKQPFKRGGGKACPQSMTIDRIIPELGYVVGNVMVVSYTANTIKYNCTNPGVFRRVAEYVEAANVGQPSSVLKFLFDAVAIRSYYPTNYYYAKRPERRMAKWARERAKRHGVPFAIKAKDIRACFPKDGYCPITRLPFERGEGKCGPQSMSLDRIIPELGYVPGNIAVISHLANAIKQNCTDPEIFRRIADYLEEAQKPALRKAG